MGKDNTQAPLATTTSALVRALPVLTEKQERWCRAYLEHGNATRAALACGWPYDQARNVGSKYRRHPACREWLAIADEAGTLAAIKKRKDLRRRLLRNDELAIEGHPITDKNGNVVGTKRDITASNRAIELVAKLDGLLTERVEHSGSIDLLGSIRAAYAEHTSRRGVVDGGKLRDSAQQAMAEFWDGPNTTDGQRRR